MLPAFTLLDLDASGEVSVDEFEFLWRFEAASLEELNDLRSFLREKVGLPEAFDAIVARSGEEMVFRGVKEEVEEKEEEKEGEDDEEEDDDEDEDDEDEEEDEESEEKKEEQADDAAE